MGKLLGLYPSRVQELSIDAQNCSSLVNEMEDLVNEVSSS